LVASARKIMGLTQKEFGVEIGRPQSLVSKYEHGFVEPPGHVVMRCMNILNNARRSEVSSSDVARIVEARLEAPGYSKLRGLLVELIETISSIQTSCQMESRKDF
jgi:transcriptional regulator with XRE-family HTH domain